MLVKFLVFCKAEVRLPPLSRLSTDAMSFCTSSVSSVVREEEFGSSLDGITGTVLFGEDGEDEVVEGVSITELSMVAVGGVDKGAEAKSFDTPNCATLSGTLKKWTVPVVEEHARIVLLELNDKEQMDAGKEPLLNSQSLLPVCVLNMRIMVPFFEADASSTPFSESVKICSAVLWQLIMHNGDSFNASKITALPLCEPKLSLSAPSRYSSPPAPWLLFVPPLPVPFAWPAPFAPAEEARGSNCWNARTDKSEEDKSQAMC